MSFPTDYLRQYEPITSDEEQFVAKLKEWCDVRGFVVTRQEDPFPGLVSRVRVDAFGRSASEVESTLLEYGKRCDMAAVRPSCSYGECVIERNLNEEWGAEYSWKGRLVIHPDIGQVTSSERAKQAIDVA
jgi:hypothetical protein